MPAPPPLPVVLTLTALIDGLLEAVGAGYGIFPIRGPFFLFLWKRFSRVKQRFATIAARFAAGKGFPPRSPRPHPARRSPRARDENAFRIRRWVNPKFGWLCRVASGSIGASAFAYALRELLTTDPEMRALLAATPATARALRPLCWMLGVREPPPPVLPVEAPCAPPTEPPSADDVARPRAMAVIPRKIAAPVPPDPRVAVFPLIVFKAA